MKLSRREALQTALLAGGVVAVAGCEPRKVLRQPRPESTALPTRGAEPAFRLANRLGYGPIPGQVARIAEMGQEAYVQEQLRANLDEDLGLTLRLSRLDILRIRPGELRDVPERIVLEQLQQAAILRAVYGQNQLHERMSEFWSDHFNVFARKGFAAYRKSHDTENVVRKHALGKFPDMVRASAKSPAMLAYLDNNLNQKGVANENYARELMELHTLGVYGGYTQQDVREVARCFTGWTLETRFLRPRDQVRFDPTQHDDGEKVVLGQRIPAGGGASDADRVIEILVNHPSCAQFIASKLCRLFLGEDAPKLQGRVAAIFTQTGGDIRAMLNPILNSKELLESPPILKRPFDFMVSALRAGEVDTQAGPPLQRHLELMGQLMHHWPMPDGYPDTTVAWTGSLLSRWNFALALGGNTIPGTGLRLKEIVARQPGSAVEALVGSTLGRLPEGPGDPIARVTERLVAGQEGEPGMRLASRFEEPSEPALREVFAACIASPEFQWR